MTKHSILWCLVFYVFMFVSGATVCCAQVKDIGIGFKKRGFIQEIAIEKKIALINYIGDNEIYTEELLLTSQPVVQIGNVNAAVEQLRPGMEVQVEGEFFETKRNSIAIKVVVNSMDQKKIAIASGRIEFIDRDYAFIDGNKIKLSSGKKITGLKKSGYDGKIFNSFSDLKLGTIASVEGTYGLDGYVNADKVIVEPDVETEYDESAKGSAWLKGFHDKYYSVWSDSKQRSGMFGLQVTERGHIVDNQALQDYVSNLALRMVPEHVKNKIGFMFMVIDDNSWNACVYPNGISFINIGFLRTAKNEAQIAAVIGHEISHAIYEHGAKGRKDREKANESIGKREKFAGKISSFINKYKPVIAVKNDQGAVIAKKDVTSGATDLFLRDLPNAKEMKLLSDYSIEQELQADRVGMFLLVQAGYDPREAPIVWKNRFNMNPGTAEAVPQTGKEGAPASTTSEKIDLIDIGSNLIKNSYQKKIDKFKAGSVHTHPDNVRRFEELNRLVGAYYFDPQLLGNSKSGAEDFITAWNIYAKEHNAAIAIATEKENEERKKRILLDSLYKLSVPKTTSRLASINKPILTYKEYSLKPVVDVEALIGKVKCLTPAMEEDIAVVKKKYDIINGTVLEAVRKFKSGEVEPHEKDATFAYYYLVAKVLNERVINYAAAASVCDANNMIKYYPDSEMMKGVLGAVEGSSDYQAMIEFMQTKK